MDFFLVIQTSVMQSFDIVFLRHPNSTLTKRWIDYESVGGSTGPCGRPTALIIGTENHELFILTIRLFHSLPAQP